MQWARRQGMVAARVLWLWLAALLLFGVADVVAFAIV
jgi:hypothetical protein